MATNAITQYNDIMYSIAREYLTIGTKDSSEEVQDWNLRDMVSEMQYTLGNYENPDCIYWQDAHDECQPPDKPWYREWVNVKKRMKRFISRWEAEALKLECVQYHCSKYD